MGQGSGIRNGLTRALAAQAAPQRLLVLAVLIAIAVASAVTLYATHQPYLGLKMRFDAKAGGAVVKQAQGPAAAIPPGTVMVAVAAGDQAMRFIRDDFVIQVDGGFGPFADYMRFMQRQGELAAMQRQPLLVFTDNAGRGWPVRPAPLRPFETLGPSFLVGIVVGVVAWLVSAAIFVFRPRDVSARYLLLSGVCTVFFATCSIVYTTRELGLPTNAFLFINNLNALGGNLFSAALFCLLLHYPRRLAPAWVGLAVVAAFLVWFVAQAVGAFPSLSVARRLMSLIAIAGTFVLAAVHWRNTRSDPVARAALGWFLLSWVVVVAIFAGVILTPQMFGVDTSRLQPFGFLSFLLVYGGLAFGILRFRLFDLGEWWARIMAWMLGLAVLAGLDLAFLAGLQLSAGASLSLALLICGLVWLPFRSWLFGRIFRRKEADDRALFQKAVEIGLTPGAEAQAVRWRALMQEAFDPLRVNAADVVDQPRLEQDGLALRLPAPSDGLPALELEYAHGGRTLFSPRDVARARTMIEMLQFVLQSRDAYERGVIGERRRIAGDIHDNLGATLLSALHSPDQGRKDRYIRETLADLRSIITGAEGGGQGLAAVRKEMAERLEARGVVLDWAAEVDVAPGALGQSLRAMLREITSNIVKHAGARQVSVRLSQEGGVLVLWVEDDGRGFDPASVAEGSGLAGLRERAAMHGGQVAWSGAGLGGTRVEVRLGLA